MAGYANLTKQQAREWLKTYEEHGNSSLGAAKAWGVSRRTAQDRVAAALRVDRGSPPALVASAIPTGYRAGKSTVQLGPGGEVEREWRRLHPDAQMLADIAEELRAEVADSRPPAVPKREGRKAGSRLLEVPLFDQHFGKYCWSDETGEDFDSEKAERLVTGAVRMASETSYDEAVLVIGGDFFHADTRHNTTERGGHVLDVDTRQARVWKAATRALIKSVELLSHSGERMVTIVVIPGNHDWESSFHLQRLLAAYYRATEHVLVIETPKSRVYHKHGCVLLGWAHGHLMPMQDLAGLMAQEVPQLWASTTERVWHLGHIHKRKGMRYLSGDTFHGVTVEHLETLAATDAWHHEHGYVGSPRRLEAFLWDYDHGLAGRHYFHAAHI